MNSLLALASTSSLLAGGSGSSLQENLEQRILGFSVLQNFFKTWLKIDLTSLFTIAALMGAAGGGLQSLRSGAFKIYWTVIRFLTASISIAGSDRLNREVLNWIGAQVLAKQGSRVLTAHSERIQNDAWHYLRRVQERNDLHHEKRVPVQYLPTFGVTWFVHERHLFMVRRIMTSTSHYHSAFSERMPDEYAGAPEGDEPLVIMCLGRSVEPIKRFLNMCRDFADKQREAFITVRACKNQYHQESWDTTILRPIRPLETVHFDEKIKAELVADIANYLDPNTRRFYTSRGIPYRRGYLFHGPPGTGKTSLSLALAGRFGLELYLMHIPSVREDDHLERLFTSLPPRCIVLLEDIDAVGIKRQSPPRITDDSDDDKKNGSDDDDDDDTNDRPTRTQCTLSGLLNVLDGVASQEGRIVLMTSNFAEKLDKALVRPGRIDRVIYLGNISKRSAELMFLRMYVRDASDAAPPLDPGQQLSESELQRLAWEFSSHMLDVVFTPAQLQGYLLNYRDSPEQAVANIEAWVRDEKASMDAAKAKAKRASELKKKRRRDKKMAVLAKIAAAAQSDSDAEVDASLATVQREEDMKRKKRKKDTLATVEPKPRGEALSKGTPVADEKSDAQLTNTAIVSDAANEVPVKSDETNPDPTQSSYGVGQGSAAVIEGDVVTGKPAGVKVQETERLANGVGRELGVAEVKGICEETAEGQDTAARPVITPGGVLGVQKYCNGSDVTIEP
ncbi:putative mitochondrial chaperone BCS1-B [Diplogelasinospora grovesii]|uniref:Mitochondrial chaperone BCS1-B n=1 Tax=Diplogelasinospora grovesii TaxID=303347 RepID=A0AAN6NGF3_9PEZI|nr:putative mitochondrial chaperone BCS1-B [Diplogelasinospora grovesii]